ncbi:MAG: transposon Pol polyprotein, partial [Oxalobacteraceae bacterium]
RAFDVAFDRKTRANLTQGSSEWQEARQKEYDSCIALGVWEEVDRESLPKDANILPLKEVFKIKVDETGSITQFKARFTPKGFRQKAGVDYDETFARTAMYKTERLALSLCALLDLELVQFDVPTAFLNADVDELVYMEMPKGFGKDGKVCRLLKSLYGLKQAPRNWDRLIHAFITGEMGWTPTVSDPSFYWKRSKTGRLMLMYHFVDDKQGGRHRADAEEFRGYVAMLKKRFNIKEMESATWMLGMRITRDWTARTITLDQQLYIETALQRFGLAQCKSVSTPEIVGARNDTNPALDEPVDRQRFMEITGTLMYAAISSRPDIAHAVHYLSSNTIAPTVRHMQAAERVLRYLAGTKDIGLVFGSRNGATLDSCGPVAVDCCAYTDADWAGDRSDRKSISGWVAKINGDPISWSSKKQKVVALSTCEAELYAEAAGMQEVLWIRGMLAELGLASEKASVMYGDNQGTVAITKNGVKGERTKHVDVKYHFTTDTIESGAVRLQWIPTKQQQADIFTKALDAQTFVGFRSVLMTR